MVLRVIRSLFCTNVRVKIRFSFMVIIYPLQNFKDMQNLRKSQESISYILNNSFVHKQAKMYKLL